MPSLTLRDSNKIAPAQGAFLIDDTMKDISEISQNPIEEDCILGECYEQVDGTQFYRNVLKVLVCGAHETGSVVDMEL